MARVADRVMTMMHETTPLALLVVPVVLLLLQLASRSRSIKKQSKRSLPPSPPGALPIIGHLHLVGDLPHVSLRDLAAKHGSHGGGLMLLRLGAVRNLVASSPRAAQAILRTHDHVFASRPTSAVTDALLYGSSDVGFAPYGEHWRQIKKLVTTHLFTVRKVRAFRRARHREAMLVVAKIRESAVASGTAVDVSDAMNAFANDVVSRAVSGEFFRADGRNRHFRDLLAMNARLFAGFSLEDYFPAMAANPVLGRLLIKRNSRAQQVHQQWDDLLESVIVDHEQTRTTSSSKLKHAHAHGAAADEQIITDQEADQRDFIDVLLSVQHEYGITRDHIKAILMDMFGAGTDTSSLVLELAMAELMRHPHAMARLQAEVRNTTPQGHDAVAEEDLAGMAYLRAVIKETLRLHPPAPLLLPHLSMADCEVDGYAIPAGTRVIVNAWAIARDPGSWEMPDEFLPERFMAGGSAAGVDLKGMDFQLLPFGAGRRICPGLNFGMATVEIMLANLVYCFDWELPPSMRKEDIDMTEVFGLTVHPKEKLMLVPKPHVRATTAADGHSLHTT